MKIILKKPSHLQREGSHYRQWMIAAIVSITTMTNGLQVGWTSPMIELFKTSKNPQGIPFSESMISWIASAFNISAVPSSIFFANLADKYGRKVALTGVITAQALGWIIKLISTDPVSILIARLVMGVAAGGAFNVIPVYLKEISEDRIRGAISSSFMLGQALGIIVMYTLGCYFDYYPIIFIVIWIPLANGILFLAIPESPSYLVKQNKTEEATKSIAYLRGVKENDPIVVNEVTSLKTEEEKYSKFPTVSLKNIWSNSASKRAISFVLILITLQNMTGIVAITTYAATIVSTSSDTSMAQMETISFPIVMAVGSLFSMALIEKCGRKILIISSLILTGLSFAVLGSVITIQNQGKFIPGWVSLVAIMAAVLNFGIGLLPVPYIVISEIFSFQLRAKIMGFAGAYSWFMCFIQVKGFAPISAALGMDTTFFIFAGICFVGSILCIWFQPETKGKSLEDIEKMFARKKDPVNNDPIVQKNY